MCLQNEIGIHSIYVRDQHYQVYLSIIEMYPERNPGSNARWQKELSYLEVLEKDYDMLNLQQARSSLLAIILIHGPPGSPYEGYSFRLEYNGVGIPYAPPSIRFLDIPWSPFVDGNTGRVCMDILQDNWSPALSISKVLLSIISVLRETTILPEESGLNVEAGAQIKISYSKFYQHARQIAQNNHYTQQVRYKDEQKPPNDYPQEKQFKDGEFEQKKEQMSKDPKMLEKKEKKAKIIQKIAKKKQGSGHKKDDKHKQDDDQQFKGSLDKPYAKFID